jgi:hypothetical protein
MNAIVRRLQKLEKRFPPATESSALSGPSGAEHILEWLTRYGIVRDERESMAETTARAFGINTFELRAQLQQRAAGLPLE